MGRAAPPEKIGGKRSTTPKELRSVFWVGVVFLPFFPTKAVFAISFCGCVFPLPSVAELFSSMLLQGGTVFFRPSFGWCCFLTAVPFGWCCWCCCLLPLFLLCRCSFILMGGARCSFFSLGVVVLLRLLQVVLLFPLSSVGFSIFARTDMKSKMSK